MGLICFPCPNQSGSSGILAKSKEKLKPDLVAIDLQVTTTERKCAYLLWSTKVTNLLNQNWALK